MLYLDPFEFLETADWARMPMPVCAEVGPLRQSDIEVVFWDRIKFQSLIRMGSSVKLVYSFRNIPDFELIGRVIAPVLLSLALVAILDAIYRTAAMFADFGRIYWATYI